MSASYPTHNVPHRSDWPETDTQTIDAELIGYAAPPGSGSARMYQRRQEILDDDGPTAPEYDYSRHYSDMGGHYYPPPYPPYGATYGEAFKEQPYEDTVVFFHLGKRGVRLAIQANRKMFLALLILMLIVMNSPGITDLISKLVRSVMGAN